MVPDQAADQDFIHDGKLKVGVLGGVFAQNEGFEVRKEGILEFVAGDSGSVSKGAINEDFLFLIRIFQIHRLGKSRRRLGKKKQKNQPEHGMNTASHNAERV